MRQGNGSDIFKTEDPRNADIGIIYVAPDDDRKTVLTGILTQNKLGRKQIVIVLPLPNKVFQHSADLNDLKTLRQKIDGQIIFVLPEGSPFISIARRRRFPVFSSLETFAASLQRSDRIHNQVPLPQPETEHETSLKGSLTRPLPSLPLDAELTSDDSHMVPPSSENLAPPTPLLDEDSVIHSQVSKEPEMTSFSPDEDLNTGPTRGTPPDHSDQSFPKEIPTFSGEESAPLVEETPSEVMPPINSTPLTPHELNNDPFSYDDLESWLPDKQSLLPIGKLENPGNDDQLEDLWGDPEDYARAQSIRQAAQQPPPSPDDGDMLEIADSPNNLPAQEEDALLPPWTRVDPPDKRKSSPLPPRSRVEDDIEPLPDLPSRPATRARLPHPSQTRPLRATVPLRSRSSGTIGNPPPIRRQGNGLPPRRFTPGSGRRQARSRSHPWLSALIAFILIVLIGGIIFIVTPMLVNFRLIPPPPASVTILPASSTLQKTYAIAASTTPLIPSQYQVQARFLSYTTSSQTETTKATGMGQRPAIAARGSLTLYNALPYIQTIAAGSVFTDTNGVQLVTDRIASIPAARIPTEGFVTVAAHALVAGTSGNIPALDFNGVACCTVGITVQNTEAFSGGQDTQHYTFVQQSDIDGVVTPLKAQITQSGQTSLQAQILPSEQSVGPTQCLPTISSNHAAGDKATSVMVTVTETCTGEVYDQQAALALATNLLKMDAAQHPGPGYTLTGNIKTLVTKVQVTNSARSLSLLVAAKGTWVQQFSKVQRENLARIIAGRSESNAQTLLQHMGVARADIRQAWPGGSLLPDNPDQITIIVQ